MNIISEKQIHGRIEDGINTILSFSKDEFEKFIEIFSPKVNNDRICAEKISFYYTTDNCECPERPVVCGIDNPASSRYYFGSKPMGAQKFIDALVKFSKENELDYETKSRIEKIIECRNLDKLLALTTQINPHCEKEAKKAIDIVSKDEALNDFLNAPRDEFLYKTLVYLFGEYRKEKLSENTVFYEDFWCEDKAGIKARITKIYNEANLDKYIDPRYTFKIIGNNVVQSLVDKSVSPSEEPEWKLDDSISKVALKGIDDKLSPEEKALYIYCNLCKSLNYDEGYFYRRITKDEKYESAFSKEHLESLTLDSKINCFDFSRIYAKLINENCDDIEVRLITEGINEGHFYVGFYTDRVSCTLDAVNIISDNDVTNDLTKAKLNVPLSGIKIISDRAGVLKKALEKVYPLSIGNEPVSKNKASNISEEEVLSNSKEDNTKERLKAFLDFMKSQNISGNEMVQFFIIMKRKGLFGKDIQSVFAGEKENGHIDRMILIREKEEGKPSSFYRIKTKSLSFEELSSEEVAKKLFDSKEWIYEDEKRGFEEI